MSQVSLITERFIHILNQIPPFYQTLTSVNCRNVLKETLSIRSNDGSVLQFRIVDMIESIVVHLKYKNKMAHQTFNIKDYVSDSERFREAIERHLLRFIIPSSKLRFKALSDSPESFLIRNCIEIFESTGLFTFIGNLSKISGDELFSQMIFECHHTNYPSTVIWRVVKLHDTIIILAKFPSRQQEQTQPIKLEILVDYFVDRFNFKLIDVDTLYRRIHTFLVYRLCPPFTILPELSSLTDYLLMQIATNLNLKDLQSLSVCNKMLRGIFKGFTLQS